MRGVHLVIIFSTSFQWKSINLLFHIFRQEITVSLVYCFAAVIVLEVNSVWSCERSCQFINQLRKKTSTGHFNMTVLKITYWVSHSQILWYLWYSMHILLHFFLLHSQCLRKYYWMFISLLIPITRVYQLSFTSGQTILMENLNSKQNLRLEKRICSYLVKSIVFDWDSLCGVYWIISCISLVPLCFLCGDTLK